MVDESVKVAVGTETRDALRMSCAEVTAAGVATESKGRVRKEITWGMAEEDIEA